MPTTIAPVPKLQFFDANGEPLVGGKLYSYAAGTTTPQTTYTDYGGLTPNANPVILDSRGEASVWLGTALYKFKLTTSTDVEVWTVDNVGGFATLAQLAAASGANLINYIQSGTGAITRSVGAKLRDTVSVKDFGAVGDGVTDDTVAIQNAIDAGATSGKRLYFPRGTYIVSDANADNACLVVQYPIQILGDGPFYTAIKPAAGVAGTVNTITFNPNPAFAPDFTSVEKIFIGDPSTGLRQGAHGLFLSTQAVNQNLPKFTVRDCYIGQGGGYAIYHLNVPANNVNGGLYAALFENSSLKGGIRLENSGDSIVVRNNILSGTGTGVYAALISGASLLSILDNNITTNQSAIVILSGMRVNILRNNIEHYVAGSSSNAVIDVISSGGTYVAGVIQQNLIAIFGATDATSLITLREARGTLIQDNVFLSGIAGKTAVTLSNTCVDVRIGANSYNAAIATSGTKVNDSGTGTMGVKKNITLLNGWVEQTTFDTPTYSKDLSGNVVIEGVIKNGTATPGTVIFQLPLSARPPTGTVKRFNAYSVGGGGAEFGYFLIDEVGNATIEDGGNIQFFLSGAVFRASNASDSLSPE
jgi:hypothetical protein